MSDEIDAVTWFNTPGTLPDDPDERELAVILNKGLARGQSGESVAGLQAHNVGQPFSEKRPRCLTAWLGADDHVRVHQLRYKLYGDDRDRDRSHQARPVDSRRPDLLPHVRVGRYGKVALET